MQITLKDVARQSGCSVTTVSRALAGYDDVNEHTRQRIIEVARQLGYQPNLVARGLRCQSTQTLGLIIPANDRSFSGDFFSQLMLGISDGAARRHYDLLVSLQKSDEEELAAYRRIVGGNRVDGIILARTRYADPRIAYLRSVQHPFVVSGRAAPGEANDFPYIDVDSQHGIRLAVEHLMKLGHRHIGLILPPREIAYTGYRLQGYLDALQTTSTEYVVYGDLMRSGGYAGANQLLDQHPHLTAIVACNDLMALGAISAVQGRGLRVGTDIAITGFDDLPAAEYAHPALTTIHQPIYEIGQRLAHMLIGLIEGEAPLETQIMLPARLIVRDSSGPRRPTA